MQLSIIIVNYNVKYFLEQCLLSVVQACNGIEAEILVVDNNSTDGSKSYFENKFPFVKFYWLAENLGFGKANNYALQHAKGEHILFLNPDTIVAENCFTNCLNFFKNHPDCGAVGVRMLDGTGNFLQESKRGFPFLNVAFYKAIGLANIFPNTFGQYYATHVQEKEIKKVDVLAGAFMMLHKKTIAIVKGFDEDFFMYGEDIDLSYRIKKAGLENYYLGNNTIIHFKGESTAKKSAAYFDSFYGAMKLFVEKHSSKSNFIKGIIFSGINMLKNKAIAKNNNAKTETAIEIKQVILVGDSAALEKAKGLLPQNVSVIKITLEEIKNTIQQSKTDCIIFCNDNITYKNSLEIIDALKDISFGFFDTTANTIIGSSDKNTNGFVFKQQQ
jgi:N-acetylglucosaminyl-diphospho-decaprenol L-rhamnosyltransferase